MPPTITVVVSIVALLLFLTLGFFLGRFYRKKVAEREISSAEDEAKRIINEGIKAAENKNVRRFWRQGGDPPQPQRLQAGSEGTPGGAD